MVKRKFAEQSKILSIRVPVSKYNTLKKILNAIVNTYCRDNDLFAPEETYDLNDILGGL